MAVFSYHNDGHSYVMVEPDWPVRTGHVIFAEQATFGQLRAAFPSHDTVALVSAARDALAAGLTIELAGVLEATRFPTDDASRAKLSAIAMVISLTAGFPGGAAMPMKDSAGEWHTLTLPQWKAVAVAILNYAASLQMIMDGNPMGATELPPSSVSLTVAAPQSARKRS